MNFLAHYIVAVRGLPPVSPLPFYVCGNALPDLLPLAHPRRRIKDELLDQPIQSDEDMALRSGVLVHLATDAAFHKTIAFASMQKKIADLLDNAGFVGMHIRNFFAAHVLAELALDAALLRHELALADAFYGAIGDAKNSIVTRWAERMTDSDLPSLPSVLTNFSAFPYLRSYREDKGMAEGFNRLCKRARQNTFEGENWQRLLLVTAQTISMTEKMSDHLLTETIDALRSPMTGE